MSRESNQSDNPGDVTELLRRVQAGAQTSAQDELYQQYYQKVLNHARRWVRGQAVADEDDVAVSVWKTIFRRMPLGQFTECRDRESFEKLLGKITFRKAVNLRNWLNAPRRCPTEKVPSEEILGDYDADEQHRKVAELYYLQHQSVDRIADSLGITEQEVQERLKKIRRWLYKHRYRRHKVVTGQGIAGAFGDQPGPLEQLVATESFSALAKKYRDPILLLLQGMDVDQIASQLGVCQETVRRRLRMVRKSWEAELKEDGAVS